MFLVLRALQSLNSLGMRLMGEPPALGEGGQVAWLDAGSLHPHQRKDMREDAQRRMCPVDNAGDQQALVILGIRPPSISRGKEEELLTLSVPVLVRCEIRNGCTIIQI